MTQGDELWQNAALPLFRERGREQALALLAVVNAAAGNPLTPRDALEFIVAAASTRDPLLR